MTIVSRYKGYSAEIGHDTEDDILFGKIGGIADGVGFHASNLEDLRAAFYEAVDAYIDTCAKVSRPPQTPIRTAKP